MFWVILTVLLFLMLLISLIICSKKKYDEPLAPVIFSVLLFVSLHISFVLVVEGKNTYPSLKAKYIKLLTIQRKNNTLKKNGMILKYVRQYVAYLDEVAEYNRSVINTQMKKRMPFYYWFTQYAFVSNQVFTLSPIELSMLGDESQNKEGM